MYPRTCWKAAATGSAERGSVIHALITLLQRPRGLSGLIPVPGYVECCDMISSIPSAPWPRESREVFVASRRHEGRSISAWTTLPDPGPSIQIRGRHSSEMQLRSRVSGGAVEVQPRVLHRSAGSAPTSRRSGRRRKASEESLQLIVRQIAHHQLQAEDQLRVGRSPLSEGPAAGDQRGAVLLEAGSVFLRTGEARDSIPFLSEPATEPRPHEVENPIHLGEVPHELVVGFRGAERGGSVRHQRDVHAVSSSEVRRADVAWLKHLYRTSHSAKKPAEREDCGNVERGAPTGAPRSTNCSRSLERSGCSLRSASLEITANPTNVELLAVLLEVT